ncbi:MULTISPECIES: hypothetical protein [unclassified Empedobacter]|uniref:hypothetical protein n=1 Tax=unclassified Empedobacter TaxID=2643773 RepID=UPI0025C4548D|nr:MULTISPECIES: hypothetical protein [unclassified Empedobacter]
MEIGDKLIHRHTKNVGKLVRITYPTGKPTTFVIEMENKGIYFAPAGEFSVLAKS